MVCYRMYRDKLASFKKQLQQLKDGTHPDYNRKLKKLEANYKERYEILKIMVITVVIILDGLTIDISNFADYG